MRPAPTRPPAHRTATLAIGAVLAAEAMPSVVPASANVDILRGGATQATLRATERTGVQELFAVPAGRGSLTRAPGGYRLVLQTRGDLARFTDRPARRADNQSIRAFIRNWAHNGFVVDPPNAALVVANTSKRRDVVIVELTRPRISGRTVAFRARPARRASSGLLRFSARADRPRPMRFGAASLFVDGAPGTAGTRFARATITFSNVQPDQQLDAQLTPSGGPIAFSSGPAGTEEPGLVVSSQGALPLQSLRVSDSQIVAQTNAAFGGTPGALSVTTFLASANREETFFVRAVAGPGVEVTLALEDAPPQVVNPTQTLFSWGGFD